MSTMWQVLYLRLSSGPTGGTVCFLKFSRCTQSTKSSKKKASGLGVCTPQTKRPKRIPAYLVMICQLSSENPPFIMCHFIAHVVKREKMRNGLLSGMSVFHLAWSPRRGFSGKDSCWGLTVLKPRRKSNSE